MDYRRKETNSAYSEDTFEEDYSTQKRKYNEGNDAGTCKRKRVEPIGCTPRLSNVSSASSHESLNSSDGEISNSFISAEENASESEDEQETLNSKIHEEDSMISSTAQKMMMKMGYQKGKGLGRKQQGMVAPISASKQRGRRGLGFSIAGIEPMDNLTWDKSKEFISVQEEVCWLSSDCEGPSFETLISWVKEGTKKEDISDEYQFCRPEILDQVIQSKSIFDKLGEKELYKARSRCNPFETVGKLFFQNRAALKMANLDTVCGFMFTQPVDENDRPSVSSDELLYFADVCAAPGGFSEYVLWRRKTVKNGFCDAKGFGFTLKENDFKLQDFFAAPSEFLEPHYGENGNNGDGNVFVPANISTFREYVLKSTNGKGVHFMMADGGFSVDGQENIQEILSKRLYLCQFLVALGIVRDGGHFVCKLFDVFTPFSVGLLYIMYTNFKEIALHKPNSSRPANSERYIICKWRNRNVEDAYDYLFKVNLQLDEFERTKKDITELVPLDVLKEDAKFYEYVFDSNNVFGERQIIALQKIRAFCQDLSLIEEQQATIRKDLLEYWRLPDRPRVAPARMDAKSKANEILSHHILEQLKTPPVDLTLDNLKKEIRSPFNYRFVFLASERDSSLRGFFLGLGGGSVYLWTGKDSYTWQGLDFLINLPPESLIYGEVIFEHHGEHKAQRKVKTLHCIDALVLNGFNVTSFHLEERNKYLKKFVTAVNQASRNDRAVIRCKHIYKLEKLSDIASPPLIDYVMMKGGGAARRRVHREAEADVENGSPARYTCPTGVQLLKITQDPWMIHWSNTYERKFLFNSMSGKSIYDFPVDAIAPASITYGKGALWWWSQGVQILEVDNRQEGHVHLKTLLEHIREVMKK